MDDIGKYIINNIGMLDRNTISVANLTNKLCIKICNDKGITRNEKLEEVISDILTKYKNKEITSDTVVGYFETIYNGTTTSNSQTANNTASTANNTNNKVNNASTTNTNTNNKTNNTTTNTSNNINNTASSTNNTTTTVNNTNEKENVSSNPVNNVNDKVNSTASTINTATTSTKKSIVKTELNPKAKTTKSTVDVKTEVVESTANELSSVESEVSGISISIPSAVAGEASGIKEVINSSKREIESSLEECKRALLDILNTATSTDDIPPEEIDGISFSDIGKMAYDRRQNSQVVEADANFFIKCGYPVDGDIVTIRSNGKEYQYNLSNHTLTIDGTNSVGVKIFIPSGNRDYSTLNTYTYFSAITKSGEKGNRTYDSLINGQESNAIILQFTKAAEKNGGVQNKNGDGKFIKQYEVAEATKFINAVAKTQISNGKCKNIIGGDSVYGMHSLKMAAAYPDVYQTVYCINNAFLVQDENAVKGIKEQFSDLSETVGLANKEIYFINTGGDDNLSFNKRWKKTTNRTETCTYTGIDLLCRTYPDADVHVVYPSGVHEDVEIALKDLAESYPNCTYEEGLWYDITDVSSTSHTAGQVVVTDVVRANSTNANYYTVNNDYYTAKNI